MISTPVAASVPIVSQRGIDPIKTAISLLLALVTTTALTAPLPVPKPPGLGGSCPHGYLASGSFCTPSQGAQDTIAKALNGTCPWGMDFERELLLAKRATQLMPDDRS